MTDQQHERALRVAHEAASYPRAGREPYVRRVAADDPEVIEAALRILSKFSVSLIEAKPTLSTTAASAGTTSVHEVTRGSWAETLRGRTIDGFEVVDVLGTGGMAVVVKAMQTNPRRPVAMKFPRSAMSSDSALQRFQLESDTLAKIVHPNIAQFHVRGETTIGAVAQPYFVMEWVDGVTLSEYAAKRPLTVRQKLELMATVADAVEFASRHGAVHRDLKPGNIMITAEGTPKIVDFGLVRVIRGDDDATNPSNTLDGSTVGTPMYMSPEQTRGLSRDIDYRSDVYTLGVILHELLVGRMPYPVQDLHEPQDVYEVVRAKEPEKLGQIDRKLAGDIETIVLRALEKDQTRRYQTAGELAADIRRYLKDEPIAARPPSTVYQVRKFVTRNTALVVGVVATCLALGAGVVTTSIQRDRARAAEVESRAQRDRADQQRWDTFAAAGVWIDYAKLDLLKSIAEDRSREFVAVDAFEKCVIEPGLRAMDADSPREKDLPGVPVETRCSVIQTAAEYYLRTGKLDKSERLFRSVLALRRSAAIPELADIASCEASLANVVMASDRFAEAIPLLNSALPVIRSQTNPAWRPDVGHSLSNLGKAFQGIHDLDGAERAFQESLDVLQECKPGEPLEVGQGSYFYGQCLNAMGRFQEAEKPLRDAVRLLSIDEEAYGVQVAVARAGLAQSLIHLDRVAEAESLLALARPALLLELASTGLANELDGGYTALYDAMGKSNPDEAARLRSEWQAELAKFRAGLSARH